MSLKISVSGWEGEDRAVVIEKISKVFRMTPGKARAIMNKLDRGVRWKFERAVSDRQGREAKAFLVSLGFTATLTPANSSSRGMGLGVNPYAFQEDYEEAPADKGLLTRIKEKIIRRGE